jgi:hypothetical protein
MSTPSLLLVPARLKDGTLFSQIPTNGSGDFTVVQAVGNATRVNASGFVESAKTNLLQRSEEFENAYWSKALGVVTQNETTAPDGLTTADKYVVNNLASANSPINRVFTFSTNTTYTLSLFVKKADYNTASIRLSTTETGAIGNFFNLASGTATNNQIQDYGNGWYRVWVSFTTSGTVTNGTVQLIRDAQVRDGVAGIFIWGAQLEEGSSPSDYIPTTTVARTKFSGVTVNGTSIANVPRLDYYTSSGAPGCPGLLVEPAGTNFARNAQRLNTPTPATASGGITVTTGSTDFLAPDGSNGTITKYVGGTASGSNFVENVSSTSVSASGVHTFSAFVKAGATNPLNFCALQFTAYAAASGTATSYFNIASGTALTAGATIQDYGNGWYRIISAPYTIASGDLVGSIRLVFAEGNNDASWPASGALNLTLYAWGIQLEAGSVATSYIPTTTGSVTRNADVISASGNVSGSIGQTEGSIYVEVDIQKLLGTTQRAFIDIGQAGNRLFLGYGNGITNQIRFLLQTSAGGLVDFQSAATTTGIIRIAVGYKNNDSAMYVNGVSVSPLSNGSFTATLTSLTQLSIGSSFNVGETHFLNDKINAVALYGTRLSNDALMLLSMQGNDAYLPQAIWNFYEDSRAGNTEVPTCLYTRHADIIDV